MQSSTEAFQISMEAAEIYEARFVPAFFAEWAPHLVDFAARRAGPGGARRRVRDRASSRARSPIGWARPAGWSAWTSTRPC